MKIGTAIIGSGIAGSIIAQELLDAGERGLVLFESGNSPLMQDRRTWLDYVMQRTDPFEDHRPRVGDWEQRGGPSFKLRHSQLRARGGTTLAWHGIAMRLQPEDFHMHTLVGMGADWPFDYAHLESYYAAAEDTLQVAGDATDPGHPPRSTPFPLPRLPFELDDDPFIRALWRRGATVQHQCISRNTASVRGQARCQTTGTCRYCPFGARLTGDQLVDRLARRPGIEVRSGCTVTKIEFATATRASGLQVRDVVTGATKRAEAKRIVVCGGGIESPKLLLRSRSGWWPQGLGNREDLVGRYFFTHPLVVSMGQRSPNPGRVTKELGYPTATSRYYDDTSHQREGKFSVQCWGMGHDLATMMIEGKPRSEIEQTIETHNGSSLASLIDEVPEHGNRVGLADGVDRFGLPRTRIEYQWGPRTRESVARVRNELSVLLGEMGYVPTRSFERPAAHPMGTCRMAHHRDAGVVDPNLRVHGTENVYVCSSAVFPTGGAVNPTLTIAALAHRLGRYLGQG